VHVVVKVAFHSLPLMVTPLSRYTYFLDAFIIPVKPCRFTNEVQGAIGPLRVVFIVLMAVATRYPPASTQVSDFFFHGEPFSI
jgi:hypothetical protein